jgi:type IV secretion system protein VirD4
MGIFDELFGPSERDRWASRLPQAPRQDSIGLPRLGAAERQLYGEALPRGVNIARAAADRAPVNSWCRPADALAALAYQRGDILLGKLAGQFIGSGDDRPLTTVAAARAGKTSTILEPNLLLYPGSMLVLDPKGELARQTALIRRMLGHDVQVLDPFGQSGGLSASFNIMDELDPDSRMIVDDAATIAQAIIVDEGDHKNKHWTDSARELLKGVLLFTLTRPLNERNLVTVRQLLTLTHPALLSAVRGTATSSQPGPPRGEAFFAENRTAVETLLMAMADQGDRFGGALAGIGRRMFNTPPNERGSIFSTASANTDFLDSIPLRDISLSSGFRLDALAGRRPLTVYLCLPVGRMESHYRWLRMIVQQACNTLERRGVFPRDQLPILFMMEEFATLGHMDIMERAAAYFPGFGVKLWAVIQDISQLQRFYPNSWETFLGNSGMVQCFANSDGPTLNYIAERTAELIHPFELRTAFSREGFGQILMPQGMPPVAAARLDHHDVEDIREYLLAQIDGEIAGYLLPGRDHT